jgi:hypothetical protein
MRKLVSVLVAAMVITGCGGTANTATPGTPREATVAPASSTPDAPTTAAVQPLREGALHGTYSFLDGLGTVDVPAGWEGCCDAWGVVKGDFTGLLFDDLTNVIVYADSCHWKAGPNPEPKGAEATAAAFSAQGGHQGTEPEAITVDGIPGWRVTLTVPADQAVTGPRDDLSFTGCDEGQFASWAMIGGDGLPSRFHQAPSQTDTLYLVDVGSRTIVFDMISEPAIAASDQAELDAMLASVKFD